MKNVKLPKNALRFNETLYMEFSDDESERASMMAYSGQPMEHPIIGKLAVDVSGIKFVYSSIPILEEHDEFRKIGFSSKPDLSGDQVYFKDITLLDNEYAQEFKKNARKGFPYQASIAFYPKKVERIEEGAKAQVNGYELKGPALIFRETTFRESSVVAFGMDHKTNSQTQGNENLEVLLSDKEADMVERIFQETDSQEKMEFASLTNPRTPKYDGTEDSPPWGSIKKSLEAYKEAFGYGDADWHNWNEAPAEFRNKAASTSFAGDADADVFGEGVYYPAVNPKTMNLNRGGVLAAQKYAASEGHDAVANKADQLYKKIWGKEKENSMSQEDLEAKLKEYDEKFEQQKSELEVMRKDKIQTELSQKLSNEDIEWIMKFYDRLGETQLHEIADKVHQAQKTIDDLGKAQGSEDPPSEPQEPTFKEISEYAEKHGISHEQAMRDVYKQYHDKKE